MKKSILYYTPSITGYAEACNEWRRPSLWHGIWQQKRHNDGEPLATALHLITQEINTMISQTDSDVIKHCAN